MDVVTAVETIKRKFKESGGSTVTIPLQKGDPFTATLTDEGISVSNLGDQPFLPWVAFQEAVCILIQNGGKAMRGDAMKAKLGEAALPLDSVEGHISLVVYGKRPGDAVFRHIAPIAAILIWAHVCNAAPKELLLVGFDEPQLRQSQKRA